MKDKLFVNVSDYQRLFNLTYNKAKELDDELEIILQEYIRIHPDNNINPSDLYEGFSLGVETIIALLKEPKYRKKAHKKAQKK